MIRAVHVFPEVAPFSKTGGLGDVGGTLPRALAAAGVETAVLTPLHRPILRGGFGLRETGASVRVPMGSRVMEGRILASTLPGGRVPVYFIGQDELFSGDDLYGSSYGSYAENDVRFIYFSRAVPEAIRALDLQPDILHLHDWPPALAAAYLRERPLPRPARVVLTLHNLAYQGIFAPDAMLKTGLDPARFHAMQDCGRLNFLKAGLAYADAITTVSPTYAREIATPEFGCGLDETIRRRGPVHGILNGIDIDAWDPARDPLLPAAYDAGRLDGKAACRVHLLQKAGLSLRPGDAVIGMVGRLAHQKGVDLVTAAEDRLMSLPARWVILGTGEPSLQDALTAMARRNPGRFAAIIGYDETLAHEIQAGSDLLLMPSRYEPCGLNQMYGQRYGTIPVARRTGGLADTIVEADPEALAAGTATGFLFGPPEPGAAAAAVERALTFFRDCAAWTRLVRAAMSRDFSWARSAEAYRKLYEGLLPDHGQLATENFLR